MSNKKIRINAHEINIFTYCPHQWYYNHTNQIDTIDTKNAEEKNINENLSRKTENNDNFEDGQQFHLNYQALYEKSVRKKRIFITSLVILGSILLCLSFFW
ncbi:hypothetical protein AN641_02790 [Candidatus Epulonipiscioides gigas]|nr:hypothetical protein AN641_02790 [Epulopiscium sp. SCG-C07WGA-EpuloA2]